jgi:hypothetical protein
MGVKESNDQTERPEWCRGEITRPPISSIVVYSWTGSNEFRFMQNAFDMPAVNGYLSHNFLQCVAISYMTTLPVRC